MKADPLHVEKRHIVPKSRLDEEQGELSLPYWGQITRHTNQIFLDLNSMYFFVTFELRK